MQSRSGLAVGAEDGDARATAALATARTGCPARGGGRAGVAAARRHRGGAARRRRPRVRRSRGERRTHPGGFQRREVGEVLAALVLACAALVLGARARAAGGTALRAPARGALPHRSHERGGGGGDVRGAAQAPAAPLVAAPAARPALGGARGAPHPRRGRGRQGAARGRVSGGDGEDGGGGAAQRLPQLPRGASRRGAPLPPAARAAALEEARGVHQAREAAGPATSWCASRRWTG